MSPTNRKAYVLVANGRMAAVDGRWRSYGREAFLAREDADAAVPGFLGRCRDARDEVLGPDPDTLAVTVVALELEDAPGSPDGILHVIGAEGRDAWFGGLVPFLCATAFTDRAGAEAEVPAFLARCADPALGARHAEPGTLTGRIGTMILRDGPSPLDDDAAAACPGPAG